MRRGRRRRYRSRSRPRGLSASADPALADATRRQLAHGVVAGRSSSPREQEPLAGFPVGC